MLTGEKHMNQRFKTRIVKILQNVAFWLLFTQQIKIS